LSNFENLEETKFNSKKDIMALQATDSPQGIIQLSGSIVNGNMVKINYNSLPGAHPKTLGYFVAIWQGNQIQGIDKAESTKLVSLEDQGGSITFDDLNLAKLDYIIGFGVSSTDGTSICATLPVPKSATVGPLPSAFLSTLMVTEDSIGSDSLVASYVTPIYNRPKTNNNWIALFLGGFSANMFSGTNVIKFTKATSDNNIGAIAMNDIPHKLVRFETYTLVYGTGLTGTNPNYGEIISYYTFTV
jgi:hypothetical protein